jgi:hypothetical protein
LLVAPEYLRGEQVPPHDIENILERRRCVAFWQRQVARALAESGTLQPFGDSGATEILPNARRRRAARPPITRGRRLPTESVSNERLMEIVQAGGRCPFEPSEFASVAGELLACRKGHRR